MKKYALIVAAFLGTSAAMAQDEAMTNKNGYTILPEAGDYAIQMDAVPLLNFGLNAVNIGVANGNTAMHPNYVSGFNQVLVGKYFADASTAYRGRLAINSGRMDSTSFNPTPLEFDNPTTAEDERSEYEDNFKTGYWNVTLGGGLEMRRGHNRLQGYYGGEVFIGFGRGTATSMNQKNTYGLEYNQQLEDSAGLGFMTDRTITHKEGMSFTLGLRGFAGIEYFIAPKISVGAEFGWGAALTRTGRSETVTEKWVDPDGDGTFEKFEETTEGGSKSGQSGLRVDNGWNNGSFLNGAGSLNLILHF